MAAKRKHNRKKTIYILNIVDPDNPDKSGRGAVIDISMGGAAFECEQKFEKGESVELRFNLSKDKIFILTGTVKRVKKRTAGALLHGVQFNKLCLTDKFKLYKLIKKITK